MLYNNWKSKILKDLFILINKIENTKMIYIYSKDRITEHVLLPYYLQKILFSSLLNLYSTVWLCMGLIHKN